VRVVWSRAALRDVIAIREYLLPLNPAAARQTFERLTDAGDTLARFPRRGRAGRAAGTRELVVVAPYVLVYRVVASEVRILRVWHSARDR
jgi:toxin ParE1/3/4